MIKAFFYILFFAFNFSIANDISNEDIKKWAFSKEWKALLHYKKSSLGNWKSLVDGEGFFFSKNGKTDLAAELQASILAMTNNELKVGAFKLHPQCAFPARYWFLKNKVGISSQDVNCPKVDEFYKLFHEPETVSIVFSSAYPNNPASMFGHTFLKINSKNRVDITDMGINYAAKVSDDENPFAFIYFGIFGGYVGQWGTTTYHAKIKEYVQGENRDLWEYELNLSKEETKRFLHHLWELETNSYFKYYFFDENCSYQILAALETIKPEWEITDHTIYMIPGESIKNLFSQEGIVKSVHFRPSIQKQIFQKYEALNSNEKTNFYDLIDFKDPKNISSSLALETAMLYFDFLNIKNSGKLSDKQKKQQLSILSQRATLGSPSSRELAPIPIETRPDLGHDSYSLHFSQTARERKDSFRSALTTQIKIKSAYHDLMNKDLGFKRYSHIDFPAIEFQYDSDLDSFRINEITALNITSLPPLNFLSKSPAWKIESGLKTFRDYGCLNCRHSFLELGVGASFNIKNENHIFYFLTTARGELYSKLSNGYRYGPGIDTGFLFNPYENIKFKISYEHFWDLDQNIRSKFIQYYVLQNSISLERNLEFRSTLNWTLPEKSIHDQFDGTLELIYFFN